MDAYENISALGISLGDDDRPGDYLAHIQRFLEKSGFSPLNVLDQGGWFRVLLGMIPGTYSTVATLVEAVKKS